MSETRKISIRKVIQTLVTIIVVTGCTIAVLSADHLQNSKKVRSVSVHIRNTNRVHFLDNQQVMALLFKDRHIDPENTTIAKLDIHRLETIARTNPWVSDAQVYIDNERNVHIFVTQRVPVARLFEANGNSYYIDSALRAMPVSTSYVHYAPVITGAAQLSDDSAGKAKKGEMLSLVNYISNHQFWNAQIAQIVVVDGHNYELIPVLGKQRILLGDTSRLDEKLDNLFAFYQQVENKVGWDKYQTIDLRYQDQVVASPSIKWKIPVDRALSNMSWVKAVLESGNKNEKDEAAITDPTTPASATVTPKPATTTTAVAPVPKPVQPSTATSASIKPKPRAFAGAHKPMPVTSIKPKHKPVATTKPASAKPAPHAKPKLIVPAAKKDSKPKKKALKPEKKAGKKKEKTPVTPAKKDNNKKTAKKKPQAAH